MFHPGFTLVINLCSIYFYQYHINSRHHSYPPVDSQVPGCFSHFQIHCSNEFPHTKAGPTLVNFVRGWGGLGDLVRHLGEVTLCTGYVSVKKKHVIIQILQKSVKYHVIRIAILMKSLDLSKLTVRYGGNAGLRAPHLAQQRLDLVCIVHQLILHGAPAWGSCHAGSTNSKQNVKKALYIIIITIYHHNMICTRNISNNNQHHVICHMQDHASICRQETKRGLAIHSKLSSVCCRVASACFSACWIAEAMDGGRTWPRWPRPTATHTDSSQQVFQAEQPIIEWP